MKNVFLFYHLLFDLLTFQCVVWNKICTLQLVCCLFSTTSSSNPKRFKKLLKQPFMFSKHFTRKIFCWYLRRQRKKCIKRCSHFRNITGYSQDWSNCYLCTVQINPDRLLLYFVIGDVLTWGHRGSQQQNFLNIATR